MSVNIYNSNPNASSEAENFQTVASRGSNLAEDMIYDNTNSGLTSVNVQDAIDEVNEKVKDNVEAISQINTDLSDKCVKKPQWNKKIIFDTTYTPTDDCYVSVFARGSASLYCEVTINGNVMYSEYLNETTTQFFYIPKGITISYTLGGGTVYASNFVVSDTL